MKIQGTTLKSDWRAITDLRREDSFIVYYKDTIFARLYRKNEQWFVWIEYLKTRIMVKSATEAINKICEVAKCEKFLRKRETTF